MRGNGKRAKVLVNSKVQPNIQANSNKQKQISRP
jgi:hypothetical protein